MKRYLKHWMHGRYALNDAFPGPVLKAIETAIGEDEKRHRGQICFAVETALDWSELRAGTSARERAIDVFSHLRVWDTHENNGVLIYVLLAERDVEIVADRGIHADAGPQAWEAICKAVEQRFRARQFEQGALEGIRQVGDLLVKHYPTRGEARNELPNRPRIL